MVFTTLLYKTYAVPAEKVTICHATGAGTFVRIVVSANAIFGHFDNPGSPKAGHESDILLQGEAQCPVPPIDEEDPPEDEPEDVPDDVITTDTPAPVPSKSLK